MKIKSPQEILAFQLEGLYDGEKKLQHFFHTRYTADETFAFKEEMKKIENQCSDARLKLKRAFSYLLLEPLKIKNNVVAGFIKDFEQATSYINDTSELEALALELSRCINAYKIFAYSSTLELSRRLSLEQVSSLLDEILADIIACDTSLRKCKSDICSF